MHAPHAMTAPVAFVTVKRETGVSKVPRHDDIEKILPERYAETLECPGAVEP